MGGNMEAKDRLVKCEDQCPDAGTPCCNDCDYGAAYEEGAKDQAEISFKAGEVEGFKRGLEMQEPYLAGIREVVGFVDTHKLHGGNISIPKFLWQAFKKSNGV
jgi:hypothetical protein